MRKLDLLVLVAVWDFLIAFFTFVGILAIAIFGFRSVYETTYGMDLTAAVFGLSIGILVLVIFLVLGLAAGIGLVQDKNWGRVLSIAVAAMSLLWIPIGTAIGILIMVYLARQDVKDFFLAPNNLERVLKEKIALPTQA